MKKIAFLVFCFGLFSSLGTYAQNAPVTVAGIITTCVPGTSSVPIAIKVAGFTNIGKFTLTMKFDTTRVRFVSAITNPSLPGMTVTYSSPPTGNKLGKLIFAWTGTSNLSLADSSSLADLVFSYTTGTGLLAWYFAGTINEYRRYIGGILTKLNDDPRYQYYKNGGISNRGAPVATIATVLNAAPGLVSVPVTANNFINIKTCSLAFDYLYAGLHFSLGIPNSSLVGCTISDSDLGNGKHRVLMGWFGTTGVSLTDGSVIMTVKFTYISGNTPLEFFDDIESCEYADGAGDVLIDLPTSYYFHNGGVTPPLVANFTANKLTPPKNDTVLFTDLSTGFPTAWNWSFDRPGVIYVNGTSSSSQNPQVKFTDGGLYTVTLLITNLFTSDSELKTAFVRAGTPGKWTGNTSSSWSAETNWENWLVPDGSIDVVIPPAATFWPVVGDLILGTHCHNLTLSGATSKMTITGNLMIP